MAIDEGRHAELADQQHRALQGVVQQDGRTVATVVHLAGLGLPAAVAAAQVETVLFQQVPVVREQFFGSDAYGTVVHDRSFGQKEGRAACR